MGRTRNRACGGRGRRLRGRGRRRGTDGEGERQGEGVRGGAHGRGSVIAGNGRARPPAFSDGLGDDAGPGRSARRKDGIVKLCPGRGQIGHLDFGGTLRKRKSTAQREKASDERGRGQRGIQAEATHKSTAQREERRFERMNREARDASHRTCGILDHQRRRVPQIRRRRDLRADGGDGGRIESAGRIETNVARRATPGGKDEFQMGDG